MNSKLQIGRYGAAAVVVNKTIYVIGGFSRFGMMSDIEVIRGGESVTRLDDPKLLPRRFHAAASSANYVYIIGGETANPDLVLTNVFERLDLSTGKLEILPPLPTSRRCFSVVIYDDSLFVIGGSAHNIGVPRMDIYSISNRTWSTGPTMPMARECSAALVGSRIFVVGGYCNQVASNLLSVYSIEQGEWFNETSVPQPVSGNRVAAVGKYIVTCGDYQSVSLMLYYNTIHRSWATLAPCLPTRNGAAVALENKFYSIGGSLRSADSFLDTVQCILVE